MAGGSPSGRRASAGHDVGSTQAGVKAPLLNFQPPSQRTVRRWLALPRAWHRPRFSGLQHVDPARPTLFVGNHTLFGVLDVPHILAELQRVHGIFPRTLGDRAHFAVPLWRDLLLAIGCVEGTRENCSQLMRSGQHVMVFPGGAREVFKRKGEAYRLIWKNRLGFVQMAATFGYRIVPFASLGADEALHIDIDAGDIMRSPIGKLLRATGVADRYLRGGEELPPLVHGLGPTWLPVPARFFISFGRHIATSRYRHRVDDVAAMQELRQKVAVSIQSQLARLHKAREQAQA